MIASRARVALVQSAERLPGVAPRFPTVVRIGIEYQLVGQSLGGDGIVAAEYRLWNSTFTRGFHDRRGILTSLPDRCAADPTFLAIRTNVDAQPGCHGVLPARPSRRRVSSARAPSRVSNRRSLRLCRGNTSSRVQCSGNSTTHHCLLATVPTNNNHIDADPTACRHPCDRRARNTDLQTGRDLPGFARRGAPSWRYLSDSLGGVPQTSLPELSNSGCRPGRAGGSPTTVSSTSWSISFLVDPLAITGV